MGKWGNDKKKKQFESAEARWEGKAQSVEASEARWEGKAQFVEASEKKWDEKASEADEAVSAGERKVGQTERSEGLWQERPELKEKRSRRKRKKNRFRLSGSMFAKVLAFCLFAISLFVGSGLSVCCLYLESENIYNNDVNEVLSEVLYDEAEAMTQRVRNLLMAGNIEGAEALCVNSNAKMELWYWSAIKSTAEEVIWSTWDGDSSDIFIDYHFTFLGTLGPISLNGHIIQAERLYLMRIYIDPAFAVEDEFKEAAEPILMIFQYRYELLAAALASLLISLLSFIFLMYGAGHRNGNEGIVPGVLSRVHLDVLTFLWGGIAIFGFFVAEEFYYYLGRFDTFGAELLYWVTVGTCLAVWMLFYLIDLAVRLKLGGFWKNTLVYVALKWGWKTACQIGQGILAMLCKIPLVMTTVMVYLGICILEFFGVLLFMRDDTGVFLWAMEKVVLFVVLMVVALTCKKLQKAGEALADGQENYQVDTSKMIGVFKAHGDNLNSIGQGITKAVEARMKSEHMKTELITNVSHDIKTPLTSIINYADLIAEENTENEKIAEYSEVLLRQSKRLKKLLEDLVDASKATTGNLEVNLQPCEVGVLLTQAAGEYEQKMAEKSLNLIVRQPEETVKIMADGRHLWRVFDNLLNNICKYAQEGSRVYLSLENQAQKVSITFRNMSKYALDVSAEELEERFVRGDKSRHMEGNGLGLSIAKSLVELQNGKMEIVIDGDLFKVSLCFQELKE